MSGPEEEKALLEQRTHQLERELRQALESLREAEKRIQHLEERGRHADVVDEETQRLAFEDSLTGLPNFNIVRQYADLNLRQVMRYRRAAALLVIDLDRFSVINDAMGFTAGDELLKQVAERLRQAVRESDVLGRKGEDEFMILLSQIDEEVSQDPDLPARQVAELTQRATLVAQRVIEMLAPPFDLQGQKVHVEASIGISLCPGDAENAQQLFEHAYMAITFSKENGRGRCEIFNALIHEQQMRRLVMENQLRLALNEGQFLLHYQPIVDLSTRNIVGVEALLRWNHPQHGIVRPREFLPVAEESGIIVAVGEWVLREGTRQLRKWWEQGLELFLCLNVSPRQLLQADLPNLMLSVLGDSQVDPRQVVIDIAEGIGTIMEPEHLTSVLTTLGGTGVRVAIDDFGTGASSMKTLRLEHTRFLKIASNFITGIPGDRQSMSICLAAIRLSASLNMKSLAQGIETERQCNYLAKNECELGQGFFFSQPVPAEEIPGLIRDGKPGHEIIGLK